MATGNTTLLGLALPVQGELDGTWGTTVNNSITSLVDSAVAGTTTLSTDIDVTLTTTVLAANQARQAVILWTATNGANTRSITAPAQSKPYIVINAGTGSIVLRGAGPTTGVTIVSGEKCLAAWNGSDFVKIATSTTDGVSTISFGTTGLTPSTATAGAVTVAGTLAVANGGTGATSLTANNVILGNGTSAVQVVAPGTSGNILTSNGTTWISAVAAASGVTAVSVVSANGLAGTSSGGATPALTLSTSVTGVLKGNGTAISAATAGTDYVTPTGTETLTNKTIEAGTFTNGYTEETVTANTSTAYTIDLANGTVQYLTLTGNCTYTFPTPVAGKSFMLVQKQDATGSRTVTWPASVDWPNAAAPTLTSTASKADKFVFTAIDGSNWLGSVAGQNYTV
jgi:hypothetical protein